MMTRPTSDARRQGAGARGCRALAVALAIAAAGAAGAAPQASPATTPPSQAAPAPGVFAIVGDVAITHQDYEVAFAQAARSKFYHGKPPENAVAALQREVGQSLVDEVLLVKEARRLGLQPDEGAVQQTLDEYERRYRGNAQWLANRERLLPGIAAKLQRDSLVEQLKRQVRQVGAPTSEQLQQYYEQHQDKFTTPEQVRLSVILLKVDPSSAQAKWDSAKEEGAALVARLRAGADFRELANLHSGDRSAEKGGDMGLVHVAMLPDAVEEVLAKLKPGEISDATYLLEGVAIFRIEERRESRLNPLEAVRQRAADLWARDQGERAWTALLVRLREQTPVQVDDSRYLPLATASAPGAIAPR